MLFYINFDCERFELILLSSSITWDANILAALCLITKILGKRARGEEKG